MFPSVRAFLNEIIDYAGLFPPAKLPMDEAVRTYLHERKSSPHAWMLGRFVCQAARLHELTTLVRESRDRANIRVTALVAQSASTQDFNVQIESACAAINNFRAAFADSAVDMVEIPVPTVTPMEAAALLGDVMPKLVSARLHGFFECAKTRNWKANIEGVLTTLAAPSDRSAEIRFGLKLRCGGLSADAFPSDAEVACFIARCRAANVPWKATAGLHHPRRHFDQSLGVWHHGFLNVFGAGLLASANSLTEADLVEILADRAGKHFRFDENGLAWKDWKCTTAQIEQHRADFATSFGSCSFAEPCADLQAMRVI